MDLFHIDIDELFGPLSGRGAVALAISGGGDSMALMHLFALWRAAHPLAEAQKDVVFSVDHGLRDAAAGEVAMVLKAAEALGFEIEAIRLEGLSGKSSIQAGAREARYQAMVDLMAARGVSYLMTGHNLDDQAETFLMRLRRGSGLEGLCSIEPLREMFGISLLRPLLSLSRADLRAWLVARDISFVDDPSNEDEQFERVELRQFLDGIDKNGSLREMIAKSVARLQASRAALKTMAAQFIGNEVSVLNIGVVRFEVSGFRSLPSTVQDLVLVWVLERFGASLVALSKIEAARVQLLSMDETNRYVLAGVMIERRGDCFKFCREVGRGELESITVHSSGSSSCSSSGDENVLIWDKRVRVSISKGDKETLVLRAFTLVEAIVVSAIDFKSAQSSDLALPVELIRGMVGVWQGGDEPYLISVPQLLPEDEVLFIKALGGMAPEDGLPKVLARFPFDG